ncbi:MAG: hypothetical protein MUF54_08860 [Polyangiaceae bacterium]|jgi:hypothetical protein|nr:hypothetical protein [Polyangiaceae bacterium]
MTQDSQPFDPDDLRFFGAIAASISHEMKNVVTIINEAAGLLHDLSLSAEAGKRPLDPTRIKKMSADVGRNVERGVGIINRMNRFAHSVDEPERSFNLGDLVSDAVALASRFAAGRSVELRFDPPREPVLARAYPFGVYRAVISALHIHVCHGSGLRPVVATVCCAQGGATVRVSRSALSPGDDLDTRLAELSSLVTLLRGAAHVERDDTRDVCVLRWNSD